MASSRRPRLVAVDRWMVFSTRLVPRPIMVRMVRIISVVSILAARALCAQQSGPVSVGTATAAPGTTAYGAIAVPAGSDSALSIAVAVIRGRRPGPTVAFVA